MRYEADIADAIPQSMHLPTYGPLEPDKTAKDDAEKSCFWRSWAF